MARYSISLVYLLLGSINFIQAEKNKSLTSRLLDNTGGEEYYVGPTFIDDGLAQLTDFAGQCIDEQMMNANDPIDAMFKTMEKYCSAVQETKFELALKNYEQCDGARIEDFIETYWDSVVGVAMTCSGYMYRSLTAAYNEFQSEFLSMKHLPFEDRMPAECIESLLGNHGFGNFIRQNMMSPKRDFDCLKTLGREVPNCTLRKWPVPIVGPVLKFFSCADGNFDAAYAEICDGELEVLNNCLPSLKEIKNANEGSCKTWINTCTIAEFTNGKMPSFAMIMPAPLSAAPFPDICVNDDVTARYKAYQNACLSKEDLKIWSKSTNSGKALGSSSRASATGNNSSSSSNHTTLFFGFLIGVVGTVGVAFLIDYRKKRAGNFNHLSNSSPNSEFT